MLVVISRTRISVRKSNGNVFYFMTLSRLFVVYLSIKFCFFCDSSLCKIAL